MTTDALTTTVAVLAAVSLLTLVLSLVALRATSSRRRAARASRLPTDVRGLRAEVEALRHEVAGAVRRLAVVRYDAFGDMGGRLSWSMAVLDDGGNGVVVTSIHGRSDARTYAKSVVAWSGDQQLSPEESDAIQQAKLDG
ncbi:MAG: no significant homology Putative N-terminal signal sequence was found by PSORT [uncultured Nocardioidaceae bacterium]|uniref:No significant homology Putative N-terminal signal sequence was found by PSORT n=1 Tax=uncultured Nocardioidaceae bacterium TaxID=253824 RepID=A0A6J4LIE7_9ACTN|nr:MAG: no significant homology Putative N-terminal signal sequence was found by PSORT [uncultured Nocardioidaceae bacterium]